MLEIAMASFRYRMPTIALLLAATLFAASNSRAAAPANPDNRAEGSADDHHYWQWGMGFYYPGITGRWTELDAARADWLLLRFGDLAPSKETTEQINRLLKMNPRLKIMIRVWPMRDHCPHKGAFTYNMRTGLGCRLMYDYFFSPGVKEKIHADARRQVRSVLDHIDKPENVVGMTLLEEAPQFISDMGIFMKDGETNWAIEAYREEIEADYGKPFVWNSEARRWWCKKYVQIHDELHTTMKEASDRRVPIFYWQQTGYIDLDHLSADELQDPFSGKNRSLVPIHLADIIKPGYCDGLFGYGSASRWETDTLRFARERNWPFWSQLSHPCFMRDCKWEEAVDLVTERMPQNLGTVFFCSGNCAGHPRDENPTIVDESIPIEQRQPSGYFGNYQVEHTRRVFAQQNVGMDVMEQHLVPELALDYHIDASQHEQTTRILLQVHNTKDASWYLDPQQAVLKDVNVRLTLPEGIEFVANDKPAGAAGEVAVGNIEADGYRVVTWPVRVQKGTSLSESHPLEATLTAGNCPEVKITGEVPDVSIPGMQPQSIWLSGQSWVEPTFRRAAPLTPVLRLRGLYKTAVNPVLTIGSESIRYEGTLSAGQELRLRPGQPARMVTSSLVVGDPSLLHDPTGPHGTKAWHGGGEYFSLRVMNPPQPGAKIRVTISGKVAGGAKSMIRVKGYKLPASYHSWISKPLLVGRLHEKWQNSVSQEIVLPAEADIRHVCGYNVTNDGTIWYNDISVTVVSDDSAEGVDVSDKIHGEIPALHLLSEDPEVQVQRPMVVTYRDDSRPGASYPRVEVQLTEK